jgi:tRNA G18 (ribose-2'-O)-methylase SpoU
VLAPLAWETIEQVLSGAPPVYQILASESKASRTYESYDLTRRTALLIGNEAHGISAEARKLVTGMAGIPMWNKVESLNAAIAASVILFEAARQRRVAGPLESSEAISTVTTTEE